MYAAFVVVLNRMETRRHKAQLAAIKDTHDAIAALTDKNAKYVGEIMALCSGRMIVMVASDRDPERSIARWTKN